MKEAKENGRPKILSQNELDQAALEDMDDEDFGEDEDDGGHKWLALAFIAIAIIAFFAFFIIKQPTNYMIDGVKFESPAGAPENVLRGLLGANHTVITVELPADSESRPCFYSALTEITQGVSFAVGNRFESSKNPFLQVESNGLCTVFNEPSPQACLDSAIVLRSGECNCVKLGEKQMIVEGNSSFMCGHSAGIGAFIVNATTGIGPEEYMKAVSIMYEKISRQRQNATQSQNNSANAASDIEPGAVNASGEKLGEPLVSGRMPASNNSNATVAVAGNGEQP